ncbi:hypothetical protein MUK42_21504 [Musa troglodytarum]|uniref:Uncharacterized protein n=1 Tax=Musa troglodytarum TaxID=320322 RepID=A0A9E7FHM5_9LILI|nr:hypothetical protein MUK42_21504 [Musa troglodytarum]
MRFVRFIYVMAGILRYSLQHFVVSKPAGLLVRSIVLILVIGPGIPFSGWKSDMAEVPCLMFQQAELPPSLLTAGLETAGAVVNSRMDMGSVQNDSLFHFFLLYFFLFLPFRYYSCCCLPTFSTLQPFLRWGSGILWKRYSIPEEYILAAPEAGQQAFDPIPKGFALTLDALEADLRLPLHPIVVSCISLW